MAKRGVIFFILKKSCETEVQLNKVGPRQIGFFFLRTAAF